MTYSFVTDDDDRSTENRPNSTSGYSFVDDDETPAEPRQGPEGSDFSTSDSTLNPIKLGIRGLKQGVQNVQAMAFGAAGLVGSGLGVDSLRDYGFEGFQRNTEEAAQFAGDVRFTNIGSVEDAYKWTMHTFGTLVPTMVEAAAGAAVGSVIAPGPGTLLGGFASRTLLKRAVNKAVKKTIEHQIKKGIIKEGADAVATKALREIVESQVIKRAAAKAGALGATFQMEAGGMFGQDAATHGVEDASAGKAALLGAAAASLELLGGNIRIIDKIFGNRIAGEVVDSLRKGNVAKAGRVLKEAARQMPAEALQETGQEFFGILNEAWTADPEENFDILSPENVDRLVEAGAAGGLAGLGFGGATGVFSKRQAPETPSKAEVDPTITNVSDILSSGSLTQDAGLVIEDSEGTKEKEGAIVGFLDKGTDIGLGVTPGMQQDARQRIGLSANEQYKQAIQDPERLLFEIQDRSKQATADGDVDTAAFLDMAFQVMQAIEQDPNLDPSSVIEPLLQLAAFADTRADNPADARQGVFYESLNDHMTTLAGRAMNAAKTFAADQEAKNRAAEQEVNAQAEAQASAELDQQIVDKQEAAEEATIQIDEIAQKETKALQTKATHRLMFDDDVIDIDQAMEIVEAEERDKIKEAKLKKAQDAEQAAKNLADQQDKEAKTKEAEAAKKEVDKSKAREISDKLAQDKRDTQAASFKERIEAKRQKAKEVPKTTSQEVVAQREADAKTKARKLSDKLRQDKRDTEAASLRERLEAKRVKPTKTVTKAPKPAEQVTPTAALKAKLKAIPKKKDVPVQETKAKLENKKGVQPAVSTKQDLIKSVELSTTEYDRLDKIAAKDTQAEMKAQAQATQLAIDQGVATEDTVGDDAYKPAEGWTEEETDNWINNQALRLLDTTGKGKVVVLTPEKEVRFARVKGKANSKVAAFNKWQKPASPKESDGSAKVLLHGTTFTFDAFSPEGTNPDNFFGKGYYLTDSFDDVNKNYAGIGPDLRSKIGEIQDNIMEDAYDMSVDEFIDTFGITEQEYTEIAEGTPDGSEIAERLAKEQVKGEHEGAILPVHLSWENPLILKPKGGTRFEITRDEAYYREQAEVDVDKDTYLDFDGTVDKDAYEEAVDILADTYYAEDYDPKETGNGIKLREAIIEAADDYDGPSGQEIWSELSEELGPLEGQTAQEVFDALRSLDSVLGIVDDEFNFEGSSYLRSVVQLAGFDGIEMDAHHVFPRLVHKGTTHYVAFEPNQIKSVYNRGTWDQNTDDLNMARLQVDGEKQSAKVAAVKAMVAPLQQAAPGALPTLVVDDVSDIKNKALREEIQEQLKKGDVGVSLAVYDPKSQVVYIFAKQVTDKAMVAKAWLHEQVGHHGFRGVFGNSAEYNNALNAIYKGMAKDATWEIAWDYGLDTTKAADKRVVAEEYVAQVAEKLATKEPLSQRDKNFVDKMYEFVRTWLAKQGFDIKITDAEIDNLLIKAAGNITREVESREAEGVRFSLKKLGDDPKLSDKAKNAIKHIGAVDKTFQDKVVGAKEELLDDFKTKYLDRLHPVKLAEKSLVGGVSSFLSGYQSLRLMTSLPSILGAVFHEGTPVYNDQDHWINVHKDKQGGLLTILSRLKDDGEYFMYWQLKKSAQEQKDKDAASGAERNLFGLDQATGEFLNDHEVIEGLADLTEDRYQANKKAWDDAEQRLKVFNKAILDFVEKAGVINPTMRKEWERNIYIPFTRIGEGFKAKGIKRMKGGRHNVGDPTANLVENYSYLIKQSLTNIADTKVMATMQKLGMAKEAPNLYKEIKLKGSEIARALNKIKDEKGKHVLTKEQREVYAEMIQVVKPVDKEGVVGIRVDGKQVYFEIDDQGVVNALREIRSPMLDSMWLKIATMPKRWLTRGVTAAPGFRVANALRDTISTGVQEKDFIPFVDSAIGFYHAITNSAIAVEIGSQGGLFSGDYFRADNPESLTKLIEKYGKAGKGKSVVRRATTALGMPLRAWDKLGDATENAARIGLYLKLRRKGLARAESALRVKDLMDFSLHGASENLGLITATVPFLNARIQGLYKVGRTAMDPKTRASFMVKGLLLTAASMALVLKNADDERWQDLPDYEKWTNFHFYDLPGFGDTPLRIPTPFEIGMMFGTAPMAFYQYLSGGEDAGYLARYMWHSFTNTFAVGMPQIAKVPYEILANKSTFTGRDIIPQYMKKNLEKHEQKYPWTSKTAQVLGDIQPGGLGKFRLSPKELEHLSESMFGWMGKFTLAMADLGLEYVYEYPNDPTPTIEDNLIWGRFLRSKIPRATKWERTFYKLTGEADKAYTQLATYKKQRDPKYRSYRKEKRTELQTRKRLSGVRTRLQVIRGQQDRIYRDTKMSSVDKRTKINALQERRNKIIKQAVQGVTKKGGE